MNTYTPEELRAIIDAHGLWLDGNGGSRANLDGASLVGARLVGARLDGASLDGASLDGASLDGASLDGARLVGASLHAWAQAAFKGHGECGRMLTAYQQTSDSAVVYKCGCFSGSAEELNKYINEDTGQDGSGIDKYKASRMLAFETVTKLLSI